MRLVRTVVAFAVAVSVAASPIRSAFAQATEADKATARTLGEEGIAAMERKDYKTAEDRFKRADALFHVPTLAFRLGQAYAANGKFLAAAETYKRMIREGLPPGAPAPFKEALEKANVELKVVEPKVGSVTIAVGGTDAPVVTVDGAPLPLAALGVKRPIDPGPHVIKATAEGFVPAETTVTVPEGGSASAALVLEKKPADAPAASTGGSPAATSPASSNVSASSASSASSGSSNKTIGYIGVGVGGAFLALGAIEGIVAMGKASDLKAACPNGKCPSSQSDAVSSYNTATTLATVGLALGVVGVGVGSYFLVTAPKEHPKAAWVRPYVGPGAVGLVGRF